MSVEREGSGGATTGALAATAALSASTVSGCIAPSPGTIVPQSLIVMREGTGVGARAGATAGGVRIAGGGVEVCHGTGLSRLTAFGSVGMLRASSA